MNDQLAKLKADAHKYFGGTAEYIALHRVFIIIVVACLAILIASVRSNGYLEPVRDENHYTEKISEVNPKKINQEILSKLKDTEDDENSEVDSNLAPGRENPFVE